jgi:hypothetical protein
MTQDELDALHLKYGKRMSMFSTQGAVMTSNTEARQAYRDLQVKLGYVTPDFEMGMSETGRVIYWVEKGGNCIRPFFAIRLFPIMVVFLMPILIIIAIMELKKARRL